MSQWVRLWEDMPDDPKWRVVAKRSGRPLHMVLAVFTRMLINAGRSSERGTLEGWDDEDEAMALDMQEIEVTCIRNAMQGKVLEGNALTGWEKRQPKREDNSTGRVNAFRDRCNAMKRDETHCNAPEEKREEAEETDIRDANASLPNETVGPNAVEIEKPEKKALREGLQAFGEAWNGLAGSLRMPSIDEIKSGSTRERHALARLREMPPDGVRDLMARIRGSPYLRGEVNGFRCTFDWIVNASNFQKIMEGNYEDRKIAAFRR